MRWQLIGGWGVEASVLADLARPGDACVNWHQAQPPAQPSWVLGWSLGGVVASDWLAHPNVLGVMTLCTPAHFNEQVDMRTFARLRKAIQRDPKVALDRFADWLLPSTPKEYLNPYQLLAGLDRLSTSHCAAQWRLSDKPQRHWIGADDPLFQDSEQTALNGDHQIPMTHAAQIRQVMQEMFREL